MSKFSDIKKDFPIFERDINGKKLTYLDSGATSQKPNSVIDKMNDIYTVSYTHLTLPTICSV